MPTRRKTLVLVAAAAAILALAVTARVVSPSPPQVLRTGDKEAARYADGFLLTQLNEAADATMGDRVLAAREYFAVQPGMPDPYPFGSALLGATGTTLIVAVYYHYHDHGFSENFWGGPYWGRVCRVYEVKPESVAATAVTCDATVAEEPGIISPTP